MVARTRVLAPTGLQIDDRARNHSPTPPPAPLIRRDGAERISGGVRLGDGAMCATVKQYRWVCVGGRSGTARPRSCPLRPAPARIPPLRHETTSRLSSLNSLIPTRLLRSAEARAGELAQELVAANGPL